MINQIKAVYVFLDSTAEVIAIAREIESKCVCFKPITLYVVHCHHQRKSPFRRYIGLYGPPRPRSKRRGDGLSTSRLSSCRRKGGY